MAGERASSETSVVGIRDPRSHPAEGRYLPGSGLEKSELDFGEALALGADTSTTPWLQSPLWLVAGMSRLVAACSERPHRDSNEAWIIWNAECSLARLSDAHERWSSCATLSSKSQPYPSIPYHCVGDVVRDRQPRAAAAIPPPSPVCVAQT